MGGIRRRGLTLIAFVSLLAACGSSPGADSGPTAAVSRTGCSVDWVRMDAPSPGNNGARLHAVVRVGPHDAWAVGSFGTLPPWYSPPPPPSPGDPGGPPAPETTHLLIEHWNGTAWTRSIVPTPDILRDEQGPVGGGAWFTSVAASGPNDVWAVGGRSRRSGGLIFHYDGQRWNLVFVPRVVSLVDSQFVDVSADSPDDAWAVGTEGTKEGLRPLTEHWDGHHWTVVPTPASHTSIRQLQAVVAISPSDAWAVGQNGNAALVMRWNGRVWRDVVSPDRRAPWLHDIAAFSGTPQWTIGTTYRDVVGHGPARGIIERFQAGSWHVDEVLPDHSELDAVASNRADKAWALGFENNFADQVLLHFDGHAWRTVAAPSGAYVSDVAAANQAGALVVGSMGDPPTQTYVARSRSQC